MANPHHRKKHKSHLRQFQRKTELDKVEEKAKASSVFAIAGAVVGIAVLYFASQGDFLWAIGGAVVGAVIGYMIGRGIDKPVKK